MRRVWYDVTVQTAKALLKQRTVQHLYSKITGVPSGGGRTTLICWCASKWPLLAGLDLTMISAK
jgi:isochorismate synthase EntC